MRARCGMFDAILYKVLPNHRIPKSLTINRTKPSVGPSSDSVQALVYGPALPRRMCHSTAGTVGLGSINRIGRSLALKDWDALLEEVGHAFFEIFAAQTRDHFLHGKIERFSQGLKHGSVNLALDHPQGSRTHARREIDGIFVDFVEKVLLSQNLIHQPQAQSFSGIDRPGGK